jgi:hypothetical protein
MRRSWVLLAVALLAFTSCRGRTGQTAPTVVDPFLINRPTTVPPPATGTVAPLGTIQPFDPNTITVPPTGVLPQTPQPSWTPSTQPLQPNSQPLQPNTTLPATSGFPR